MSSQKPVIRNKRRNKIRLHHEGTNTLLVAGLGLGIIVAVMLGFVGYGWISYSVIAFFAVIYGIMVNFFRCPVECFRDRQLRL